MKLGRWMRNTFSTLKNTSLAAMYQSKIWWDAITFNHKEVSNGLKRTVDRQAWTDVDQPVGNERLANKPRFPCLPIEQNGGLLTKQITLRNHPAPTYSLNYPLPTNHHRKRLGTSCQGQITVTHTAYEESAQTPEQPQVNEIRNL